MQVCKMIAKLVPIISLSGQACGRQGPRVGFWLKVPCMVFAHAATISMAALYLEQQVRENKIEKAALLFNNRAVRVRPMMMKHWLKVTGNFH